MNVLVACEYSGVVRDAFASRGHFAVSCDLLPSESPGFHYQGSVFDIVSCPWDLLIAFPPCTYLCNAQVHLLKSSQRQVLSHESAAFVHRLWCLPIPHIAIENPIGLLSRYFMPPHQITHFYEHGDPYYKDICLWLKNVPPVKPTRIVVPRKTMSNHTNSRMSAAQRGHIRSRFLPGLANAIAEQWNTLPCPQLPLF